MYIKHPLYRREFDYLNGLPDYVTESVTEVKRVTFKAGLMGGWTLESPDGVLAHFDEYRDCRASFKGLCNALARGQAYYDLTRDVLAADEKKRAAELVSFDKDYLKTTKGE